MVKGSEILEILHGEPDVREFVFSLYECRYADFFKALGKSSVAHVIRSKLLEGGYSLSEFR